MAMVDGGGRFLEGPLFSTLQLAPSERVRPASVVSGHGQWRLLFPCEDAGRAGLFGQTFSGRIASLQMSLRTPFVNF